MKPYTPLTATQWGIAVVLSLLVTVITTALGLLAVAFSHL